MCSGFVCVCVFDRWCIKQNMVASVQWRHWERRCVRSDWKKQKENRCGREQRQSKTMTRPPVPKWATRMAEGEAPGVPEVGIVSGLRLFIFPLIIKVQMFIYRTAECQSWCSAGTVRKETGLMWPVSKILFTNKRDKKRSPVRKSYQFSDLPPSSTPPPPPPSDPLLYCSVWETPPLWSLGKIMIEEKSAWFF